MTNAYVVLGYLGAPAENARYSPSGADRDLPNHQ